MIFSLFIYLPLCFPFACLSYSYLSTFSAHLQLQLPLSHSISPKSSGTDCQSGLNRTPWRSQRKLTDFWHDWLETWRNLSFCVWRWFWFWWCRGDRWEDGWMWRVERWWRSGVEYWVVFWRWGFRDRVIFAEWRSFGSCFCSGDRAPSSGNT